MSEELMITQQDLIDWIDRPPSNDDLDLATFISTRLENFYDLENQLQQKENIIKEVREKTEMKIKGYKDIINTLIYSSVENKRYEIAELKYRIGEQEELLEILDKERESE